MILVELPRDNTSDMAQPWRSRSADCAPGTDLLAPHRLAGGAGHEDPRLDRFTGVSIMGTDFHQERDSG